MRAARRRAVFRRRDWPGLLAALALFGTTAALEAAVKMVVRADGSKYVFNDTRGRGRPRARPAVVLPDRDLDEIIGRHSRERDLDEKLVRAVIQVESAFDSAAVSHKGAMGLMQLMPQTASELAVGNPYDPEENVRGGTLYLRRMLDTFGGRLEFALAAYNAGPDAVRRFGGVPPFPETRGYVESVMRLYKGEVGYTLQGSPHLRGGRKTYLFRDSDGRLRMSTSAPAAVR